MKKILTLLTIVAFSSTVMAATTTSKWQTNINNKLNTLNKKEQALTDKIEAKKTESAKQQAALKAKQEANKKAVEQRKAQDKANLEKTKKSINNTVETQKNYWKSLTKVTK